MSSKKYKKVNPNPDFSKLENEVIDFWKDTDSFQKSVDNRDSGQEFVFYDGPPFANGLPHYGHLLTGFIKDTYARHQTMSGKRVERRFGWDCHGLPAEMGAEKELGFSGRQAIMEFGVDKFNNHCRSSVMKYTNEWEAYVTRQARWVDFKNSYKTMDKNFMESTLWAFKELYKKGLVYESMRVMPYSWACETPLSNFETRLDNSYRERADKSVTVGFRLLSKPKNAPVAEEYRIAAWTTTPWTLPSNLALAVSPDMEYKYIIKDGICFVIGAFALGKYSKELGEEESVGSVMGRDLAGLEYEPLFDYFKGHKNAFKIFTAEFVIEGDGTGIVHIAPGFGEDDQNLCSAHDLDLVCPVDNAGKFTNEVPDFEGMQVFETNDPIIIKLKEKNLWIKTEQYIHNYPHCWRTDTPLIYKALPSWYVRVTDFKDRMVELNEQINWIPGHVKHGLFGKWLENARDWSISRNRFWGTPIPIWKSDDPKYPRIDVYGSIKELEEDFGVRVEDLHRPFIDSLTRPNPDDPTGKSTMRRVEEVFDCWFESGSMPYGQVHYPFENKEWFENHFPANFIVEYVAQTRAWFYTLMVLSTALFDRPPFLNCISHGVILDVTGQKLSKRLNNYADPMELFSKYGSDALRYTMLSSSVVKGHELLIDKDGKLVYDHLRLYIKPIWSAYHFYILYAEADQLAGEISYESDNPLDIYILSKLKITLDSIKSSLDKFDSQAACNAINSFFEVLNNWYIRRSRSRFWESEKSEDKKAAYNTLYTSLHHMSIYSSAILPLMSEQIYQGLTQNNFENSDSVHLLEYPKVDIEVNEQLVADMDKIIDICGSGLYVRNAENIRVRQPLQKANIILEELGDIRKFEDLIKDELNVKLVEFSNNLSEFADKKLSIKFQVLGKRLPSKMKEIISESKKGNWSNKGGKLVVAGEELLAEEYDLVLDPHTKKGAKNLNSNSGLVILDLEISRELHLEGLARDIIRFVQQARKDKNFDVSDKIILEYRTEGDLKEAFDLHKDMIQQQTLSSIEVFSGSGDVISSVISDIKIDIALSIG